MKPTTLAAVALTVAALILMASPATALERGPSLGGGSSGGDHQAGQDRGDRPGGDRDRDFGGSGGRDRNLTSRSDHGGHDRN